MERGRIDFQAEFPEPKVRCTLTEGSLYIVKFASKRKFEGSTRYIETEIKETARIAR